MVIHQLTQLPDGRLGVKAPDSLEDIFVKNKKLSKEDIKDEYELKAQEDTISVISLGERENQMMVEFDVTLEGEGYAGLGFGSGDDYDKYTGLVLDSKNQSVHYEGCVLSRLPYVEPLIYTDYYFEPGKKNHIKIIMENEIVITYINDTKALSTRVYKSEEGRNLILYSCKTDCKFDNIEIKMPK